MAFHGSNRSKPGISITSFKQGGFTFRKFHTNTPLPQAKIDVKEFLGIFKRALQFSISDIVQAALDMPPAKRNVLSVIERFYNPLVFLAPVILPL